MPEPDRPTPALRLARLDEADAIDALMKASTRDLFPGWYDAEQTAAAIVYVASVDRTLIADGTYFVAEADGELVACGGWSRRDKMYAGAGDAAGDARLLDPATEPARMRAMFVRSDWTRRGLGRRDPGGVRGRRPCRGVPATAARRHPAGTARSTRRTASAPPATSVVMMPNGVEMAAVMMEMPLA